MAKSPKSDACRISPVHELMKEVATKLDEKAHVSEKAVPGVVKLAEEKAAGVIAQALDFTHHAGRKKVTVSDVELAAEFKGAPIVKGKEGEKEACTQAGARRMMKKLGANLVEGEAVSKIQDLLNGTMKAITKDAFGVAKDDKRITIKPEDISAIKSKY